MGRGDEEQGDADQSMVGLSVIPNEAVDPRPQATSWNLGYVLGKAIDYYRASAMIICNGDGVRP